VHSQKQGQVVLCLGDNFGVAALLVVASPAAESLKALGGLRPIDAESIGRWRQHLPRLAGQLSVHGPITRDLIEFGYEPDDGWLAELEAIEPDLSPSHWPETGDRPTGKIRRQKYAEAASILTARLLGMALV